jgi:hypothetical protein
MHRSQISYAPNRDFGVQVALITVVSFAGAKTATAGHSESFRSCYNRRHINRLGSKGKGVKMIHNFYRHLPGDNVKLVIPVDPKCPTDADHDSGTLRVDQNLNKHVGATRI